MLNWLPSQRAPAAKKLLTGVDVAVYQGQPSSWHKKAGDISWAAVKVTELLPGGRRYVNPDAAADWRYLKEHNKGRIAYLFGHPSMSAAGSVELFIGELRKLGLEATDAVALDLEVTDGKKADHVSDWAASVLSELERRLSRKPLLYTFVNFARAGNCAGLGHYPLWIANPGTRRGKPMVPHPWQTWAIHQYVITGPMDRDVANYPSLAAMATALGKKEKEPVVKNLGGTLTAAVASARWPGGEIVVAGRSIDGYIQATRMVDGIWTAWVNVSQSQAQGSPSIIAWPDGNGTLYYIDTAGAVIELATSNHGETWT